MKHSDKLAVAAYKIRNERLLEPFEINLLKAAVALRRAHGAQRDQYDSEHVDLMARARRLALQVGQIRLSRHLTLRARQRRKAFSSSSEHECPKCGRVHREPLRMPTKLMLAAEEKVIRAAGRKR